jgi:hypothetical protein
MARTKTAVRETSVSEHLSVTPIASNNANGPVAKWMRSLWRPIAALTYLGICVFDFIIAPYYVQAQPHDLSEIFKYVLQMPVEQQSESLAIMYAKGQWESLTLQGGGLFHIAFGAILGAAAWTRGMEKREAIAVEKTSHI